MDEGRGSNTEGKAMDSWDYAGDFRRKHGPIKVVVYLVLMIVSFAIQRHIASPIEQGIVAQFQVIISVYLAVSLPKYGFLTAFLALGIEFLVILLRVVTVRDWSVL
ncbi:MAG: hypothetical protein RL318_1561, partial [Fibrobacterota bacterium]